MKKKFFKFLNQNLYLISIVVFSLIAFIGCSSKNNENPFDGPVVVEPTLKVKPSFNKVASILHKVPKGSYVMVMAHRGGFITTPENSISAIQNSMDIGVDIVELDVHLSKDGFLVIMHDDKIDRTTNGKGLVSDYTLAQLKQFKLLNPNGTISNESIPSLKEALAYSKGKMHLFIDKSDDYLDLVYADMLATNTVEQAIMGGTMTFEAYKYKYSAVWEKINYIPRAGTGQSLDYINGFEQGISPLGYFPSCELISSNNDVYQRIKEVNKWLFTTTLKGSNCSEETLNPVAIWNWELQQGTDGIFTDKSKELIAFLNSKGLHNNE